MTIATGRPASSPAAAALVDLKNNTNSNTNNAHSTSRFQLLHRRFARLCQIVVLQKQRYARELQRLQRQHQERIQQLSAAAELTETRDTMRLQIDLPGIQVQDVEVSVQNNVLTIAAVRHFLDLEGIVTQSRPVCRRFAVHPALVNVAHLRASLQHGVLTLVAPRNQVLGAAAAVNEPQAPSMPLHSVEQDDDVTVSTQGQGCSVEDDANAKRVIRVSCEDDSRAAHYIVSETSDEVLQRTQQQQDVKQQQQQHPVLSRQGPPPVIVMNRPSKSTARVPCRRKGRVNPKHPR